MKNSLAKMSKFLRDVRAELLKVIWPGRRQTFLYTGVVLASVVIIAGIIWFADLVLGQVIGLILR